MWIMDNKQTLSLITWAIVRAVVYLGTAYIGWTGVQAEERGKEVSAGMAVVAMAVHDFRQKKRLLLTPPPPSNN